MKYVIFAEKREDCGKVYWNRKKKAWQETINQACKYPTQNGVNRVWYAMTHGAWPEPKLRTIGWKKLKDETKGK